MKSVLVCQRHSPQRDTRGHQMFVGRDPKCCEELNLGGSLEIELETPTDEERAQLLHYSLNINSHCYSTSCTNFCYYN